MVASVALVYEPLRIAVHHEVILGVLVVSEQVGGVFEITCKIPVQSAEDCALLTNILKV